jgi:photosystem II stability/assembly factor-like uncharacterized protein
MIIKVKVRYSLFLILLIVCFTASAQPWVDRAKKKHDNPNFYDIQKEFNNYWKAKDRWNFLKKENAEQEKPGWEQFKRWEYMMAPRVYPTGNFPNTQHFLNEIQKKENQKKYNALGVASANWSLMGPINAVPLGGTSGIGRVNCVRFDPNNSTTIWAGTPAGGLWKSTDNGSTWSTNTDQLPVLGVTDVAINPNNTNIMYIATGDGDAQFGDTKSVGVMKSLDGGLSWNPTGLNWNVTQGRKIHKLLLNPIHPDTIIAATSFALYITADGGNNWTQLNAGDFFDVEFKPTNTDTVYAVDDSKFLVSSDGGFTWVNPPLNGLPNTNIARMALSVTADNANAVYILMADGTDYTFKGLYKSTNSGANWTTKSTTPNVLGHDWDGLDNGGQGWYDLALAVSPVNENDVYVGGVNIWKSTNGGTSWSIKAHWYGDNGLPYVHADQHALEYQVVNGNGATLFAGNDGGVYKKEPGNSWSDKSAGLQISQYYNLGVSQTNANLVLVGAQDNGTNSYNAGTMEEILGGDGFECIVDNTNANKVYGELYYGDIRKSVNGGNNFSPIGPDNNGGWNTPYVIDPNNNQVLYAGYKDIYKSTDEGYNWTKIAPNLAGGQQFVGLVVAPSDSKTVYAMSSGYVFKTNNGGISWTNVSANLPVQNVYLNYITTSNTDANKVWVTFSGYFGADKVYRSDNGGVSWINASLSGLPNVPVNCIVYENNSPFDAVYVGTDLGVYYYNNTMSSWIAYNSGLPNVIVNELEIQYSTGKLRAATYGRGLWQSDVCTVALFNEDATIVNATYPTSENMCDTSFAPIVRIKNNGINNLVSDSIKYAIDGNIQTYYWTGNLATGAYVDVTLPVVIVSTGNHTFNAYSTYPNNQPDGNVNNDAITTVNFTVTLINTFTYLNTFNSNANYWQHNAAGLSPIDIWTWGIPSGILLATAHSGTRVYATNLAGNYTANSFSYLETPCYDFTNLTHPRLEFYMAYDIEQNGDALTAEYSLNNGASWQKLGNANDLGWYNSNVNNGAICNGSQWTGTNASWQLYGHDLTAFAGQNFVKFRFNLSSNSSQELEGVMIDDFTIYEYLVGIEENDKIVFNLYPNPNNGILYIDIDKLTTQNIQLAITNTLGETVAHFNEDIYSGTRLEINMQDKPEGIYFITLYTNNNVITKKLTLVK